MSLDGTPLNINLGAVTTAACEEGSRSVEFLEFLSAAFYLQVFDDELGVLTMLDPDTQSFTGVALAGV